MHITIHRTTTNAVGRYIKDLKKYKLLSPTEEKQLFVKFKNGDKKAGDEIVERNLRLVISIVKQHKNKGVPLADLIQEGNISLMKAVSNFDQNKNFKFSTYATECIGNDVLTLFKNKHFIRIPDRRSKEIIKYRNVKDKLNEELGREPTIEEIAKQMKKRPTTVLAIKEADIHKVPLFESDSAEDESLKNFSDIPTVPPPEFEFNDDSGDRFVVDVRGNNNLFTKSGVGTITKVSFAKTDTNGTSIVEDLIKKGVLEEVSPKKVRLKDYIKRPSEILGNNFDKIWSILLQPHLQQKALYLLYDMEGGLVTMETFEENFVNGNEIFHWLINNGYLIRDFGPFQFHESHFNETKTPDALVEAIGKQIDISEDIQETPIKTLNRLLEYIYLYRAMKIHPEPTLEFIDKLEKRQQGEKVRLAEIKGLNRFLIETNFPLEAPRSVVKKGRYWGIKITNESRDKLLKKYPNEGIRILELLEQKSIIMPSLRPKLVVDILKRTHKLSEKSSIKIIRKTLKKTGTVVPK